MTDLAPVEHKAPADHLTGWDSIEFWVGNARAMAGFLSASFGFEVTGYAGPETGVMNTSSYLMEQGDIRIVVTAGLNPDSHIWNHVRAHGDGAQELAFTVDDHKATFDAAVARGATPVDEPYEITDDHGTIRLASIKTYGDTKHTFVDRSDYHGTFRPGFSSDGLPVFNVGPDVGLTRIDHIVGNVEEDKLDDWVKFYEDVMGFTQLRHFDESQISTEFSALRSTVVWNGKNIVMPLNEPAEGKRKSQIQEYVDAYGGAGVQHMAFKTDNILQAIDSLRKRGVRFLEANESYYEDVRSRLAHLDLDWDEIQRLGILVDYEDDGYLLQLFTEPVSDRPTVFIEIIQRGGAKGFGEGNFKALFESIEREQARRGNL